ncbi:tetratricopeptide repeat protein [Streptomyces sp. NPDC059248]|uniref:AfsR/SARP family transcriptional regulator n=1 Tax=Streptomyces sp. NPDC059248 TaxID=3346791 RepID=UPI0036BCEABB
MEFEIRLSGSVGIWTAQCRNDLGSAKTRVALAALAWDAGRTVGVDTLIHRIWDEHPPGKARVALRVHISRIRNALRMITEDAPAIISRTNSYVMQIDPERIDLRCYISSVEQARSFRDSGDKGEALNLLDRAEAHWYGEPMAGMVGSWVEHLRSVVGESNLVAARTRAEILLADGKFADAVPVLLPVAGARPADEGLAELLAVAFYGADRTAEATKLLQRTRQRVVRDIGLDAGRGLHRVQQGILAGLPAVSLLRRAGSGVTPLTGPTIPHAPDNLPRDVPWVGRREELRRLTAALCEAGGAAAVVTVEAIDGMGGVGKTALAVHTAHRLRDRFPDGCVYLHLGGRAPGPSAPASTRALTELLRLIGLDSKEMPNSIDELTALWRSMARERRMLVILDDAATSEHVLPLLPGASPTVVVVTSRRRLSGLPGVRPFFLDVLPPEDAAELFVQRLGRRPGTDPAEVTEIIRICNHLPLAIEIAASRLLARPSWTTLDLLRQLRTGSGRLAQLHDGERTMTHVFALSYRALTAEQQLVFRRAGLHFGVEFGPTAIAALAGCTVEAAERLLEELLSHRLVSEPAPHRFTMHDLLRDYARALATSGDPDTEGDARRAVESLVNHYVRTADRADRLAYPFRSRMDLDPAPGQGPPVPEMNDAQEAEQWLIAEGANLLEALDWLSAHGTERQLAMAVHALAGFLDMEVPLDAAESLLLRAVAHWNTTSGETSKARALLDLGAVQTHGSRYAAATATVQAAQGIARSLNDPDLESECIQQLSVLLWQTGQYAVAYATQKHLLDYLKSTGDVLRIARSQNMLGILNLHLGQNQEALDCFTSALLDFTGIGDRRGRYSALNNLGKVFQKIGDQAAAHKYYKDAMEVAQGMGNRRDWAMLRINFASVLEAMGRVEEALDWYELVLPVLREVGDRRGEAIALNGLGRVCRTAGRIEEALGRHVAALSVIRRIQALGDECDILFDLALTERETGRISVALGHLEESLSLSRTIGAPAEEARAESVLAEIRAEFNSLLQ